MDEQSGERILYEERLWWPWRGGILFLVFAEIAASLVVLIPPRPDAVSSILVFAVATGAAVFWIGLFQVAWRRTWHRIGEQTLRFGRCNPIPVEAVREVRLISGEAEIKRWVKSLSRDAFTSLNPKLRGILAPRGVKTAVLIRVDPLAGPLPHSFLLGTRHPDELLEALFTATAANGLDKVELMAAAAADRAPTPS